MKQQFTLEAKRLLQRFKNRRSHLAALVFVVCLYSLCTIAARVYLDEQGQAYIDRSFLKATTTFALVRGLNAFISVLQESQISVKVGVGGDMAIGQALDPINDLVERFSVVMLMASTSLGIQSVCLRIGQWLGLRFFLVALGLLGLSLKWAAHRKFFSLLGYKLLIFALAVRIFIPVAALTGSLISTRFLQTKYDTAVGIIQQTQQELETETQVKQRDEPWYRKYHPKNILASFKQKITTPVEKLAHLTAYVIDLIVVFVIETIAIPLATLWGLQKVLRLVILQ